MKNVSSNLSIICLAVSQFTINVKQVVVTQTLKVWSGGFRGLFSGTSREG